METPGGRPLPLRPGFLSATESLFAVTLIVGLLLIHPVQAIAGNSYTLSGIIKNAETGEPLAGASIVVREQKSAGVASRANGFYAMTLPAGQYTLEISCLGFKVRKDTLTLDRNRHITVALVPEPIGVEEVLVSGARPDRNLSSTQMGLRELGMQGSGSPPVLFGERDPLKTIQLLPGLQSAGEGHAGIHARGGASDQNLVLLDGAPIYNPAHLLGFVSVFNADAIEGVKAVTGGIPAEYGGRLSSVIDVAAADGEGKEFGVGGGVGLIASRLTVAGPIAGEKGSFVLAARRTYADLFLKLSSNPLTQATELYFYDMNVKTAYRFGATDRLTLSGYHGHDRFRYPEVFGYQWGNSAATLRWNHLLNDHFLVNTSLIFSDYEYENSVGAESVTYGVTSGVRDLNLKTDFEYFPGPESLVKFGLSLMYHRFTPGTVTPGPTAPPSSAWAMPRKSALEDAAYISHEAEIGPRLKVTYGLRVSFFGLLQPGTALTPGGSNGSGGSAPGASGGFAKVYTHLEPRLALSLRLDEASALKASYTETAQYLHLLSSSSATNPNDLWIPSSGTVAPQHAHQIAAGYFRNSSDNMYEGSFECYYKSMADLIEYKNGADLQLTPDIEALLLKGRGWSYGMELLVRKTSGRLSGWLAYTWSRTMEQFPELNGGRSFPARQDRTHDVALVAMYDLSSRWQCGATWVYATGNAVTFPRGAYMLDGRLVPYYTERNGFRMPAYHRMDLSVTYSFTEKSSLNLSVYNVYNRMNAYAILFRAAGDDPRKAEAVQLTLFPVIPSLTFNFKL